MPTYSKSPALSTKRRGRACARCACAVLLCLCALLAACGASEPPKPTLVADDPELVLWPRAEKALRLHFRTDRNLNTYDGKAHSLQICVYQLDKPEAFLNLASTAEGIATLLRAEPFDASVKNVTRLFVQPLEETFAELDRAASATFVGIVCGYFDSTPQHAANMWPIKPRETKSGVFFKSTTYSAGTMNLSLHLTVNEMVESGGESQ